MERMTAKDGEDNGTGQRQGLWGEGSGLGAFGSIGSIIVALTGLPSRLFQVILHDTQVSLLLPLPLSSPSLSVILSIL